MKLDFEKNMIVSSNLKRLFWEQTTRVDEFPSFTNLSCRVADPEKFINSLCAMKIQAIMEEDNCNVIKAIVKLMKIYNIAKISEFKLIMAKNSANRYLPIKCTMILKNMCVKGEALSCQFTNISVNIAKHDKCASNKYFNEALYKTDWYPVEACITGCVWENIDVANNLWHKRTELLHDYNEYITAKYNQLPLPPDNNVVFVVLSPNDTLGTTAWKSEGANDINITGFGYDWETSQEIYEGILCNNIAIIREDLIEHPTAKDVWVRVYTCVYVNIIKMNREIPNGVQDKLCEIPLKDCMIMHMGEINLLKDVSLFWDYDIDIDTVEVQPNPEVNPFSPATLNIKLKEVYGGVLKYTATFIDKNMDNLTVDTEQVEEFNIPNSGCGCNL